jgi:hypothetical protein
MQLGHYTAGIFAKALQATDKAVSDLEGVILKGFWETAHTSLNDCVRYYNEKDWNSAVFHLRLAQQVLAMGVVFNLM